MSKLRTLPAIIEQTARNATKEIYHQIFSALSDVPGFIVLNDAMAKRRIKTMEAGDERLLWPTEAFMCKEAMPYGLYNQTVISVTANWYRSVRIDMPRVSYDVIQENWDEIDDEDFERAKKDARYLRSLFVYGELEAVKTGNPLDYGWLSGRNIISRYPVDQSTSFAAALGETASPLQIKAQLDAALLRYKAKLKKKDAVCDNPARRAAVVERYNRVRLEPLREIYKGYTDAMKKLV